MKGLGVLMSSLGIIGVRASSSAANLADLVYLYRTSNYFPDTYLMVAPVGERIKLNFRSFFAPDSIAICNPDSAFTERSPFRVLSSHLFGDEFKSDRPKPTFENSAHSAIFYALKSFYPLASLPILQLPYAHEPDGRDRGYPIYFKEVYYSFYKELLRKIESCLSKRAKHQLYGELTRLDILVNGCGDYQVKDYIAHGEGYLGKGNPLLAGYYKDLALALLNESRGDDKYLDEARLHATAAVLYASKDSSNVQYHAEAISNKAIICGLSGRLKVAKDLQLDCLQMLQSKYPLQAALEKFNLGITLFKLDDKVGAKKHFADFIEFCHKYIPAVPAENNLHKFANYISRLLSDKVATVQDDIQTNLIMPPKI